MCCYLQYCTAKIENLRSLCFKAKEPDQRPLNSAHIPSFKEGNFALNFFQGQLWSEPCCRLTVTCAVSTEVSYTQCTVLYCGVLFCFGFCNFANKSTMLNDQNIFRNTLSGSVRKQRGKTICMTAKPNKKTQRWILP